MRLEGVVGSDRPTVNNIVEEVPQEFEILSERDIHYKRFDTQFTELKIKFPVCPENVDPNVWLQNIFSDLLLFVTRGMSPDDSIE